MAAIHPARRYRFGIFEADQSTGELRRQGLRLKLSAQPFQVLCMLLERPGELLTREEISRELWPDGTFVDFDHGVNSAVNRIREALGDTASNPRFVETLARRGYRFVSPVEPIAPVESLPQPSFPSSPETIPARTPPDDAQRTGRILASVHDLPRASYPLVRTLFILLQCMYLAFYFGALANLPEIQELLSALPKPGETFILLLVTAAVLIPVRAFVLCMALFRAPRGRAKFLRIWPSLLPFDILWSLSPFLLLHHIDFGIALACTALLVYSPFAQRSLVLMGAAGAEIAG